MHETTDGIAATLFTLAQDGHIIGFDETMEMKPVVVKTPVPVEQKAEAPKAKVIQLKPVAKRPCEKCGKPTLQPTFKFCLPCHKQVVTERKLAEAKRKLEGAKVLAEEAKERKLQLAKNAIITDARALNLRPDDQVTERVEVSDDEYKWKHTYLDITRDGVTASLYLNGFEYEQREAEKKYQRQQKLEKEKAMEQLRLAYFGGNLPTDAVVKINGTTEVVVRHGEIAVVFQDHGRRERLAREAMERQSQKARERGIKAGLTVIEAPRPDAVHVPLRAMLKHADLSWGACKSTGSKKQKNQNNGNKKGGKKGK